MRFLHYSVVAMMLGLASVAAQASPDNPQSGVDYRTLDKPQPSESAKKIEVIEFFWYACPHCNALEPLLADWVKKQGDNILFKRIPVAFRDSFIPQQKLYYTLEAMGKSEDMQRKIFHAIHNEHQTLDNEAAITDFIVKQGIDKQKFMDLYNSFGIQAKVRRAAQLQEAYKVDGVPLLAIDNRFETSPSIVGAGLGNQPEAVLHNATLQVANWLIARAKKEKDSKAQAGKPSSAPR